MKSFDRIFAAVIALILLIFASANTIVLKKGNDIGRAYRVEINRVAHEIENKGIENIDLSWRDYVTHIEQYGDGEGVEITFSDEEDCRLITVSNGGCTLPESELTHIFDSF